MRLFLILCLTSMTGWAGEFDNYTWRSSFRMGGGHYQPTLKIEYTYKGNSAEDYASIAVPRGGNLVKQRVSFKVDGKKVDAKEAYAITYWSHGKEVPVYLPSVDGSKVTVNSFFLIKNIFVIPPAPTNLPIKAKKMEVGFAPLQKFKFSGSFIGKTQKFKSKRIVAKEGEPSGMQAYSLKNVKANGGEQGLFYLVPKEFNFSMNLLRGAQQSGNASSAGLGSADAKSSASSLAMGTGGGMGGASADADLNVSDLKPYSMLFYQQKPQRDWKFAQTWMQQERTYLPFGILPGGRVKSRTLFLGAGKKTDDLIPWRDPQPRTKGDSITSAGQTNQDAPYQAIDLFLADFRKSVNIDKDASRHVAYEIEDKISPAMANKMLATEIHHRFKLETVPAMPTIHDPKLAASLPIAAFDGIITAINIKDRWFFLDAANPAWDLRSAGNHLKGHAVVVMADKLQMSAF